MIIGNVNVAFLMHIYQPPTQSDQTLKTVVQECYTPLLRLIKSRSNSKFTLNVPLSLLELLHNYKHDDVIKNLKELVDIEKVELTSTGAYHPLLTKLPADLALNQIVLNEYALGYYFGQHTGFEGEQSILIKDVKGFFPPELAINSDLVSTLSELNYEWVLADRFALDENALSRCGGCVYELPDLATKIVLRDWGLSNMISFKRDDILEDIVDYLARLKVQGAKNVVIALDGEVFGHHNKKGIFFLDSLLDVLETLEISVVSVSDVVRDEDCCQIDAIYESTWSSERLVKTKKISDTSEHAIYPLWISAQNAIQVNLWKLHNLVVTAFMKIKAPKYEPGFENIAIWDSTALAKITPDSSKKYLMLSALVSKSLHSDQFWWVSNAVLYDKVLFSPVMCSKALNFYTDLATFDELIDVKNDILTLVTKIQETLKTT